MSMKMKIFAVIFWFACAVGLILVAREEKTQQGSVTENGVVVEATETTEVAETIDPAMEESNTKSSKYMKHVLLAFLSFAPALGVCSAIAESRSKSKKCDFAEKVEPVFTGSVKVLSIERKLKESK